MSQTRPDTKATKDLQATRPPAARATRPERSVLVAADPWHVPTSARRAATLNGCCPKRLARAIERGELSGARPGRRWFRVTPAAVRDWLLGRTPNADASARQHAERVVDRVLGRPSSKERQPREHK